MTEIVRVRKIRLQPTQQQAHLLAGTAGGARYAYNMMLGWVNTQLQQQRQTVERLVALGVDEQEARDQARKQYPLNTSYYGLRHEWNQHKGRDWCLASDSTSWHREYSQGAYDSAIQDLAAALRNHHQGRAHWPRYKSRRHTRPTYRLDEGVHIIDRRHLYIPRIGEVRSCERLRHIQRMVKNGAAIGRVILVLEAGHWYICLNITQAGPPPQLTKRQQAGGAVGADRGIKVLAATSDGKLYANPKALAAATNRLRRQQRTVSRRAPRPGQASSGRYRRAVRDLQRSHERVRNIRIDAAHKMTTEIVASHSTVVIENLNIAGMMSGRSAHKSGLRRHLVDANMGRVGSMLEYKCRWAGVELVKAPQHYPSSRRCSKCGMVKAKLSLSCRVYECDVCGLVLDRDVNAARNLVWWYRTGSSSGTGSETAVVSGRTRGERVGSCSSERVALAEPCRDSSVVVPTGSGSEICPEPTLLHVQERVAG